MSFTVKLAHDPDANVWYIEDSDVIGLAGEAETFDALVARLPGLISDMVQENYPKHSVPARSVEVVGSTTLRIPEAA